MGKDDSTEFICGVSQGTYESNLSVDGYKNNFIYQLFIDANNWFDYYNDVKVQERIDELIINSPYGTLYKSLESIPNEDAIEIYMYLKPILFKEFLLDSHIYIFIRIMEILGVRMNNIISYVPNDEIYLFQREIDNKKIKVQNPNKNKELF